MNKDYQQNENQGDINNADEMTINKTEEIINQSHLGTGDNISGDKNIVDDNRTINVDGNLIENLQGDCISTQINNLNLPKKSTNIPSDLLKQGSPNFVGREEDLINLHRFLQAEKETNVVAICAVRGMGGIGKTELAIQYTLSPKYQQKYTAYYWFSLREGNLAELILTKTAPYLAMPEELNKKGTIDQQVAWCWQNWHPQAGQILIVIDDVESLEDIPQKWLPRHPRFQVIVTTRQKNLSPDFTELELNVLSEAQSLELLRKIVDKNNSNRIDEELTTAKEICRRLGYLPLALQLAATYLADDEMLTLKEYLEQLNIQDESLSDAMVKGITAERGVIAAFNLSWEKLTGLAPQLAMLCSRFASAEIPWAELIAPTVAHLSWEEKAVTSAQKQLANLHLMEIIDNKNVNLHLLLREYFRYQSELRGTDFIHQLQQSITVTCLAIAKTIPQTPNQEMIANLSPVIKHLEYLSETMLDDIPNPEKNLIWSFVGVTRYYKGQGKYYLAKIPAVKCVQATESRLGANHPYTAASLNNLALLYESQGHYGEAEPLYVRAIAITEEQLGANHPQTASSLNNLALLYKSQGRYQEAESLYMRSLAIREDQLGANHPDTATSLNNLALLYESQGKIKKAEEFAQRALNIYQGTLGNHHLNTIISLLTVKFFQMQIVLGCDQQTLVSILQEIAQINGITELNEEIALRLLDFIENNPPLIEEIKQRLSL